MSLTRFSIHSPFFLRSHPRSRAILSLPANGFPVEGSTWISQTIYPKLQENWLQILERRQKRGRKKRNEVKMIHRAFIHSGSQCHSAGFFPFKITHCHPPTPLKPPSASSQLSFAVSNVLMGRNLPG